MSESILTRVGQGDATAVGECLDRYGSLVWSLALRFCGDRSEAEDAVQEIFIDLWMSARRFDPKRASEETFVALIARRRLIDARRKSARRPATGLLPETLTAPIDDHSARLEDRDDARKAAIALAELGDDPRRILTMAIYEGKTQEQIARATGLPLGTVKTHARRGLIRLRQLLGVTPDLSAHGARS